MKKMKNQHQKKNYSPAENENAQVTARCEHVTLINYSRRQEARNQLSVFLKSKTKITMIKRCFRTKPRAEGPKKF